jgi:hypothetical protein
MYEAQMCGTVTPPSANCESAIFLVIAKRVERGRLLAPRLADCNIEGHTPGVETMILEAVEKHFEKLYWLA